MENFKLSKKQIKVVTWFLDKKYRNYDAIICDGAIRSGKTFSLCLSFILWTFYKFNRSIFAICAKSIKSIRRNILPQLVVIFKNLGFTMEEKINENLIIVRYGSHYNLFYFFGGKDESSASLIQGMTLSGIFFDEVVLNPQSFVNQAIARCSNEESKIFFNCNPQSPSHWFYKNWILKIKSKNIFYIHFDMNDNPSLSTKIKLRYNVMYSGTFHTRFILGKWTKPEGLVYPFMLEPSFYVSIPTSSFESFALSCDYGIVNPMSCGLWGLFENNWYKIDEYYYDSKINNKILTDEEHFNKINEKLIQNKKIKFITIDPSASSFISLFYKHGFTKIICTHVGVLEGINLVSASLKSGKIKICKNCIDSIREFSQYCWHENSIKDSPVKENDHAMDEIRYFVSAISRIESDLIFALATKR